jgi:hypothetical protein
MSSAQDVLLQADLHRENMAEYESWVEYQEQLEDQADDDSLWGFVGSLLGATIGFLVGGPAGMAMGMGIGGAGGYYASAYDNYDENERFLARDVFKGGKFQSYETEELVDKARDWNEEMYSGNVLMTDALMKIMLQGFNTQSKIAAGTLTLEDLLMLNYADETKKVASTITDSLIPDFSNLNKRG